MLTPNQTTLDDLIDPGAANQPPGTPPNPPGTKKPVEDAEREPCACGCGKYPVLAKSRFVVGHDTRYAFALFLALSGSSGAQQ